VPISVAVFGYLLAFSAGVSFVFQQAVNANLRVEIGSPWWAGFVSYLGGTIAMLLTAVLLLQPLPSTQMIYRSHWLSWTGGVFGAIYIAISILLLPRLGAATVIALIRGRTNDRFACIRSKGGRLPLWVRPRRSALAEYWSGTRRTPRPHSVPNKC
jgi:bacterial/archaeal transporter family-2 protein